MSQQPRDTIRESGMMMLRLWMREEGGRCAPAAPARRGRPLAPALAAWRARGLGVLAGESAGGRKSARHPTIAVTPPHWPARKPPSAEPPKPTKRNRTDRR